MNAAEITALLKRDSEVEELRDALIRARKQLAAKEQKQQELMQAVYLAAKDAAFSHPLPPIPTIGAREKGTAHLTALLHLTDWQYGKKTADYNPQMCEERVKLAVAKTIRIARLHGGVEECHVMLGGDMIEGVTIFPGQAWEVSQGLYDQVFGVARLISTALTTLLANFKRVTVWEECGNHGRIGHKDELPGLENLDRMAYEIAHQQIPATPRLVRHPVTNWYNLVTVGEYRALLIHGDEIRSFGGNHPSYGITKKVQAWASGVVEPFQDCYIGHFHRPDTYTMANAGSIYITGSTESRSEYARAFVAATNKPSQRLHFIDGKKGIVTAEYRLWL